MNAALERSVSSASHGTVYFLSVASCGHAFHCLSVNYQLSTWALFEHKTRPSHAHVYLEEKQMHRKNNWCQEFCWCRSNGSVISLGQGKGFQPSRRSLRGCHSRFQTPLVRARAHCIARYRCPLTTLPRQLVFPRTLPLPACSIGQAAREDDGTLQWEWGLAKPAEVDGFVGIAVAYVHGPQPSERQLVMIQPVAKYDRQWSNCCHGSGSVQWWEPGTSLLCKVVNTGRAAAVVRSGHRIAKVIALNVRDDDRFRSLFLHYTLSNPTPEPPDEIPPTQSSDSGQTSTTTWGRYRRRQHWPAEW